MKEAESFKIICPSKANLNEVYSLLSNIKEARLGRMKDKIMFSIVERTDIKGNPDKLILIEFTPKEIIINYSIDDEELSSFRRWKVIKKVLPIIEVVSENYSLKISNVFPILDKVVSDISVEIGKDTKKFYVEIDKLKRENSELRKRLLACKGENEKLSSKIFDLSSKLNELNVKVKKYQSISPEVLKSKIIEWIKEHHGELDIVEFSKVFNVNENVVEEKVNELIREGYITPE